MLALYGLTSVLIIDLITLPIAISMLLIIYIPELPPSKSKSGLVPLLRESVYGFKFIYARKPLLGLQLTFFTFNFISSFGVMLVAPMLLARTGDNKLILGSVQSVGGVGGLVGGIVLAVWGGPKRRINGLLGGMTIVGALSSIIFVSTFVYIWMIGMFFFFFFLPMINGSSQAIWQSKVPPALQGKVFGARMLIAQISNVFGLTLVGPLADRVFEPAMAQGGALTGTFGWLLGTGPGTGMTVMILVTGILLAFVGAIAYSISIIRNVETIVPDFDEAKKGEKAEKGEKEKPKEPEQEKTV